MINLGITPSPHILTGVTLVAGQWDKITGGSLDHLGVCLRLHLTQVFGGTSLLVQPLLSPRLASPLASGSWEHSLSLITLPRI